MRRWLLGFLMILMCTNLWASTTVKGVRIWSAPDGTRVVFDLSQSKDYKVFTLSNPDRVVIDLNDTTWQASLEDVVFEGTSVNNIRTGMRNGKNLRMVIDLSEKLTPNIFELKPQGEYGHRLVVDLDNDTTTFKSALAPTPKPSKPTASISTMVPRDFIIALDAGHGGEDPGAVGKQYKTREKDVVLSVARKLERLINQEPGMHAYLIRTGDYYVSLRKRMQAARDQGADLFISLHADSFIKSSASGASVWILSTRGASSEAARWLAKRENRADLIGGISLDDKGDILASVLLDLSQTANLTASEALAENIVQALGRVVKMHQTEVQKAGFAVLKSPDVPSILVELGFLSNAQGEANLRTRAHQDKLARALHSGIKAHLAGKPQPLISIDQQKNHKIYKVVKGDTLAVIASKFNVSAKTLKQANGLNNDKIFVGQRLTVPLGKDAS